MNEDKFINKVMLNTEYEPFKKNTTVLFGGKSEISNLIEFYLKTTKKIKDGDKPRKYEENAERFKINCILGNNGCGKSRLITRILGFKKYSDGDDLIEIIDDNVCINNANYNLSQNEVILDDFFILSNNVGKSVNKYIFNPRGQGYFLCNTYNFLITNNTINTVYSDFLDEKINIEGKLNINLEINYLLNPKNNIYEELKDRYEKLFKWNDIGKKDFSNFISKIITSNGFFGTFNTYNNGNISDFKNISELLNQDDIFFYILLVSSGMLKELVEYILCDGDFEKLNRISQNSTFYNFIEFLNDANIKIGGTSNKEILLTKINILHGKLHNEISKTSYNTDQYKLELSNFLKEIYGEIKKGYSKKISKNGIFKEFSKREIEYLSDHFDVDLLFKKKSFNNLSSGQKLILTRFTNIYMEIKNSDNIDKKNFVILIDEPDLHLHLDWQKQYIKKLIDVFSTLPLSYNLHFIIATHSPFIVSDLPVECIVLLDKSKGDKYTKITNFDGNNQVDNLSIKKKTFGANFVNIINDGFFFKDEVLIGSFAEINIKGFAIAKRFLMTGLDNIETCNLGEKERKVYDFLCNKGFVEIKDFQNYIDNVGDDFLRENLIYL